ncbi:MULTISPECIES: hypothetical protein [unclassified Methanosarcina]|uniref:hypothetical protein n=1 Tax=unclassified Methanosarcina TaxID=2644672 RepID=UPI001E492DF0|nr:MULTISPECIES: hypothetical protein [unclassified Methanosarcina]MDY9926909.1 hypothetical protein [Methanosarcina sp.]
MSGTINCIPQGRARKCPKEPFIYHRIYHIKISTTSNISTTPQTRPWCAAEKL